MRMLGKLIVVKSIYREAGQHNTDLFVKKFYGQETTSHGGRYRYRRRGLLDEIPHVKLGRGVLIVRREDLGKVTSLLGNFEATFAIRDVVLTQNDRQALIQEQDSK